VPHANRGAGLFIAGAAMLASRKGCSCRLSPAATRGQQLPADAVVMAPRTMVVMMVVMEERSGAHARSERARERQERNGEDCGFHDRVPEQSMGDETSRGHAR
jgi:hypothetical protein